MQKSHKKNFIFNYIALAISAIIFHIWNIFIFSKFWPKKIFIYIIFLLLFWRIHIIIGKYIMNIFISKRENIQIMKRYREHQIFISIYGILCIFSTIAFKASNYDQLNGLIVQYFLITFISNIILFFIYKNKYKKITNKNL